MITIIDLGIGNLGSLKNMFDYLGISCEITKNLDSINKAQKIILSGVGTFDSAMNKINNNKELKEILNNLALIKKIPVLGICVGMQIMLTSGEEGIEPGLNWIKGNVKKFNNNLNIKVPHMGWNLTKIKKKNPLSDIEQRYYFVHSYYADLEDIGDCTMTTNYGVEFVAGICSDNIYGVQFHPEKSHKNGMMILKKFSKL
jgi:imidazole glycerol-phosphate synthase subunit HisH